MAHHSDEWHEVDNGDGTVTISITLEKWVLDRLTAQAKAKKLSVDQYIAQLFIELVESEKLSKKQKRQS